MNSTFKTMALQLPYANDAKFSPNMVLALVSDHLPTRNFQGVYAIIIFFLVCYILEQSIRQLFHLRLQTSRIRISLIGPLPWMVHKMFIRLFNIKWTMMLGKLIVFPGVVS